MLAGWIVWMLGPGAAWWLEHIDGVEVGGKDGLRGKDLADALDTIRGRVMALGTGVLAAIAIGYTASNAASARRTAEASQKSADAARQSVDISERGQQRLHELTEQGQVTDRYTRAIDQLGSEQIDIRLGGIYALERIARDSARDHPTVMAVLTTFVREHSHDPDAHGELTEEDSNVNERRVRERIRPDLQAALTVIGRRNSTNDVDFIDLSHASLRFANMRHMDLEGADLSFTSLIGVNLNSAHLEGVQLLKANLTQADLSEANLTSATIDGANLYMAILSDARLIGATLVDVTLNAAFMPNADFTRADLYAARLSSATLRGANLTAARLVEAVLRHATLDNANLLNADLTESDLTEARLNNVQGMTMEEIRRVAKNV